DEHVNPKRIMVGLFKDRLNLVRMRFRRQHSQHTRTRLIVSARGAIDGEGLDAPGRNVRNRATAQASGGFMEDMPSLAESILEQIADAVIYADRSGTIVRWNQAAAALFGYSAAEALGQNLDLIIPEHLRERHWLGFDAAMANGTVKLQ